MTPIQQGYIIACIPCPDSSHIRLRRVGRGHTRQPSFLGLFKLPSTVQEGRLRMARCRATRARDLFACVTQIDNILIRFRSTGYHLNNAEIYQSNNANGASRAAPTPALVFALGSCYLQADSLLDQKSMHHHSSSSSLLSFETREISGMNREHFARPCISLYHDR